MRTISGNVPAGLVPILTNAYPLVRTFRVTQPFNYARTLFIEAFSRAWAKRQVHAKLGTYLTENAATPATPLLKEHTLAAHIDANSSRRIAFFVPVNNVPITGIPDVLNVFRDAGTIAAMPWNMQ